MTVVNQSASTSLSFFSAAAGSAMVALALGIADDWKCFDGVESVTYKTAGTKTWADGKVTNVGGGSGAVLHALRRQINVRTIAASQGQFKVGDVWFEIPRQEYAARPVAGDQIVTSDGSTWNVLASDEATLKTRWRVYARHG